MRLFAEDLTISNWNADGAIDNKAKTSQFVRLKTKERATAASASGSPGPTTPGAHPPRRRIENSE